MNKFSRSILVQQFENTKLWDLIVVGGGATGLGIALDSTTRGYKTLLLEQIDFAKGTSSRSTKLVHGGVRYLAQGNIKLVREALYERGLLLKNASHLVKNQIFIVPFYKRFDSLLYTVGLKIYDILAGKLSFGKSLRINRDEALKRLTTIKDKNLKGGVVYHDGQFDDSRLAVNLAQTCIEQGATVLNYFRVTGLLKDENKKISGVIATDLESNKSYQIQSRAVINATGVFADDILLMDNQQAAKTIRSSQGIHLILDETFLPGANALMIPKTDDGRVLFMVPWQKKLILGTTDTLINEHNLEPQALEDEINFIINTANKYLNRQVKRKDVLSVFAGLRPLAAVHNNTEKTKEISRSHKIYISESGLISIVGGKWTTYRKMACDTVNKVISTGKLKPVKCRTAYLPIHGSDSNEIHEKYSTLYGSDQHEINQLIQELPELGEKIHPECSFLKAEIVWAVRYELARTVEDVLARRVRILFHNARIAVQVAPEVARIIAIELDKDQNWITDQVDRFNQLAQNYIL